MNNIDKRIVDFIHEHHVLTIATSKNNEPYCANCFYVYIKDENILVFTSDKTTKHIKDTKEQNLVAGSIALETKIIGKIRGVQFQGFIEQPKGEYLKKVKKAYLKRFPIAMLMKTTLWTVELTFIKYTDNRMGFGKKLIWRKK
ncbi:MAG: pyridoxamine 5'-phosphate oxidase family protein [Bacteroidales bacterium]|nr:pyridoxamine 5'-phosphate oxidase family protein [Bacteroidales bacterium]